jgi:PST family polysaccharide transporter
MVIGAVGVLLLTRIIGPGSYGVYGAALGVYVYLLQLSQWGIKVYLIRREEEAQPQDYHQAFSLLLFLGLASTGLAILALPLLESWIRIEGFGVVAVAMFAVLPVQLLGLVPMAHLERELDFRRVAMIELSGQTVYFLVALPLAYRGLGPWAPVAGWWAQQLITSGLCFRAAAYRPRLYWETGRARAMVGYGLGYSSSIWVWQLRNLVGPLIVGRYGGAVAVGYVTLAIRMLEQLSFVKTAVWRLSLAALARLQQDRARLVRAISEGMSLQTMALGPFLAIFGLAAPWIVPALFGPQWVPVLEIYPFIALGYLVNAMFNLHSSALYVLRRNGAVTAFHLLHITLFAGAALLLVPRLGLVGYGWAEVVALPSYLLLHLLLVRHVGRPGYARAIVWLVASGVPLFAWQLGPWAWACAALPLLWPPTRRELWRITKMVSKELQGPRVRGIRLLLGRRLSP